MIDTMSKEHKLIIGEKYMRLEEVGKEDQTMIENASNEEITLDDLGEVGDNSQLSVEQIKKMISYFNGKVNHIKKQNIKLTKRRNQNKIAKKSRKKNRR